MSSTRSGVLGFTEAELGLFLALIFMGVAAYGAGTPLPPPTPTRRLPADSSRFAVVARLAAERDSLARSLASLTTRAASLSDFARARLAQRDSLTGLPEGGTSADRAQRRAFADSLGRAIDSVEVGRAAIDADRRILRETLERLESRMEPLVRTEAEVLTANAVARRARDSAIAVARPSDSLMVRRLAAVADSLGALSADPRRRMNTRAAAPAAAPSTVAATAPPRVSTVAAIAGTGRGRSSQTPTCTELDLATGPIADVAILGPDRYRVRGQEGSLRTVINALVREQTVADRSGCRQLVRVTSAPGLAVEAYVPALVELRRFFNTTLVGPNE